MRLDKFQIKIIESWCKSNGFVVEMYGWDFDITDEYDNAVAMNLITWGEWLRFKTWAELDKESPGRFGEFETYVE